LLQRYEATFPGFRLPPLLQPDRLPLEVRDQLRLALALDRPDLQLHQQGLQADSLAKSGEVKF
jgi:hypothetical protein